jgi:hypothetical protein
VKSNYAINPTPELYLRPNRALLPARVIAALGVMTEHSVSCIYCGYRNQATSVAHIVPESLGGKNSPTVDLGVVCHKCNQYFGQKVEAKALVSFPFIAYRAFAGVPSKKGKDVSVSTTIGNVKSGNGPRGIVVIPRSDEISEKLQQGEVTQFRLIAQVSEPRAVCQMLLKVGIELLAKHHYEVAASERLSAAREFARRPRRGARWWAILCCIPEDIFAASEGTNEIEITEIHSVLFFVMRLTGVQAMIPLEHAELESELPEPEFMMVRAVC